MLRWFKHLSNSKPKQSLKEESIDDEPVVAEPIQSTSLPDTTSEHQQKIIELIQSDDIQNHRLASVMSSGIPIQWDESLVSSICRSASKLSFWIEEKSGYDFTKIDELVIGPRFFTKYAQIDTFSSLLDKLEQTKSSNGKQVPTGMC